MNPLLQRQIRRYFGEDPKLSNEFTQFLSKVNETYIHYEKVLMETKEMVLIAKRTKAEFLANMSHELRTPLNAIIGYSEMLADEISEAGDINTMKDDIHKIHNAGKHLLSLIEEILVLTRIESGKLDLTITKVQIKSFLDEITLAAEGWINEKKNLLHVEIAEDIEVIETDEAKLRQILLNLLSNAAKFTNHGNVYLVVSKQIKEEEPGIIFKVKDTGRGIPFENLQTIFEYFTHIDRHATRLEGGAGIGLATTKRYCQVLGGEITVESTPDLGSTFAVWLPSQFHPMKSEQIYHYKRENGY